MALSCNSLESGCRPGGSVTSSGGLTVKSTALDQSLGLGTHIEPSFYNSHAGLVA